MTSTSKPNAATVKTSEKKNVPAQTTPATENLVETAEETSKRTLKERLAAVTAKLKENKKAVAVTTVAVTVVTTAFVVLSKTLSGQEHMDEDGASEASNENAAEAEETEAA